MPFFSKVIAVVALTGLASCNATDCTSDPALCMSTQDETSLLQVAGTVEHASARAHKFGAVPSTTVPSTTASPIDSATAKDKTADTGADAALKKTDLTEEGDIEGDVDALKAAKENAYVWRYAAEDAEVDAARADAEAAQASHAAHLADLLKQKSARIAAHAKTAADDDAAASTAAAAAKASADAAASKAHKDADAKAAKAHQYALDVQKAAQKLAAGAETREDKEDISQAAVDEDEAKLAATEAGDARQKAAAQEKLNKAAAAKAKAAAAAAKTAAAAARAAQRAAEQMETHAAHKAAVAAHANARKAAAQTAPPAPPTTTAKP